MIAELLRLPKRSCRWQVKRVSNNNLHLHLERLALPSVRGSKQVRTLGNKAGYCHMCEISCAGIKFSAVKVSMKGPCSGGSQIKGKNKKKTKETLNLSVFWKTDIFTRDSSRDPADNIRVRVRELLELKLL